MVKGPQASAGVMQRAVFLDRDGVVNEGVVRNGRPFPPQSVEELRLLPGVTSAVRQLKDHGYRVVVVTNQPDVRTGVQRRDTVEEMHRKLMEWLPLDAIKVCYHIDEDRCACRKPRAGMLFEAASEQTIDLSASYLVGDRWRDIAAGHEAGCQSLFIDYGYDEQRPQGHYRTVSDLPEAVSRILSDGASLPLRLHGT